MERRARAMLERPISAAVATAIIMAMRCVLSVGGDCGGRRRAAVVAAIILFVAVTVRP